MIEGQFRQGYELSAYSNPTGLQLLADSDGIPEMKSDMKLLKAQMAGILQDIKELKNRFTELEALTTELEASTAELEASTAELEASTAMLKEISPEYTQFRDRLYNTFKKDLGMPVDPKAIIQGNRSTYRGDVRADIFIHRSPSRTDTTVITKMYGPTWEILNKLVDNVKPSTVRVVNEYGTMAIRHEDTQYGKILTTTIRTAYEEFITAQLSDLHTDPTSLDPTTSLRSKYDTFWKFVRD